MRHTVIAVWVMLLTLTNTAYAQGLNPGDALPYADVVMKNATGSAISMKRAAGKNGLLVIFSCNTCPFVVKNEGVTGKTLAYAAAHNVGVIVINSNEAKRDGDDSYEAMARYAKTQNYKVPYVIDENSKVADQFGASHTPEIFLFDKQMKLVYKGAMNDNPGNPKEATVAYIETAINAMIDGKIPDPATTKSIGCSIKRKA